MNISDLIALRHANQGIAQLSTTSGKPSCKGRTKTIDEFTNFNYFEFTQKTSTKAKRKLLPVNQLWTTILQSNDITVGFIQGFKHPDNVKTELEMKMSESETTNRMCSSSRRMKAMDHCNTTHSKEIKEVSNPGKMKHTHIPHAVCIQL